MDLNDAQREAVYTLAGPLLVLAGAGSGKTRVVTCRIAELIRRGTQPQRILAVTFTRKAAGEMMQRAMDLLGRPRGGPRPVIGTFHALCVQMLRRHATRLGYPAHFAIYDRSDQQAVARDVLRDLRFPTAALRPGDLLAMLGAWKCRGVRPAQAAALAGNDREHLAAAAYARYQQALRNAAAVDFDDLLLLSDELLERFPDVREQEAGRFDHILIDEYQDTNGPQYAIARHLAAPHRNLCVVGDDDQSIYAWRGADVTHILRFRDDWPEARIVRLEENYRSTGPILELANRLIAFNAQRHAKVLRAVRRGGQRPRILQFATEEKEAAGIVADVRQLLVQRGVRPRDVAILLRTNEQSRPFEQELRRQKIPYVMVGGQSFFDRKEVRDLTAFLKAVVNPRDDVSLLRIINTPPRGIGSATVARLVERAVSENRPVSEVLREAARDAALPEAARRGMAALDGLLHELRQRAWEDRPSALLERLLRQIDYQQEIDRLYADPAQREARWNSVQQVVNAAAAYEQQANAPRLIEFLDELALDGGDEFADKHHRLQAEAVVLMTLHAAKGLEFPHVYLVGLEDGVLPHARSLDAPHGIDEERRLCYVGITRARDQLTLSFPLSRKKWGRDRPVHPSRFLFEMTGQADNPKYQGIVRGARRS
jgi:DNA helicase-2/ATP-dependent DNA helicase PcrA